MQTPLWNTHSATTELDIMTQPTDNTAPQRKRLLDQTAVAWVVLGVLMLLTLTTWRLFDAHLEERTRERFIHRAESVRDNLLLRLQAYEQVLEGEGTEGFSFQPLPEEGADAPAHGLVAPMAPPAAPAAAPLPGGLY